MDSAEQVGDSDSRNDSGEAAPAIAGDTLPAALARHGYEFPPATVAQLENYCRLLWEWNEKLNLTRHTTFEKFVGRDVRDSVELSKLLRPGERVLDVGTGGGVPGIVLAILRPDLKVALCEAVGKKARAVGAIVAELGLDVPVHLGRSEDFLSGERFDALVCRAVGPLWKICKWFKGRWDQFGRLLAIKGPQWVEERGEARHRGLMHDVELRRVAEYRMTGTESDSVILKLWDKQLPDEPT